MKLYAKFVYIHEYFKTYIYVKDSRDSNINNLKKRSASCISPAHYIRNYNYISMCNKIEYIL